MVTSTISVDSKATPPSVSDRDGFSKVPVEISTLLSFTI